MTPGVGFCAGECAHRGGTGTGPACGHHDAGLGAGWGVPAIGRSPGPGCERLADVSWEKEHRGKGGERPGKTPSGRILLSACCFPMTHFGTTAV